MLWGINSDWTLFLDRDGVINERIIDDYVKSIEEFQFIHGAQQSITDFTQIFGNIFVVTNQQGIGKGLMTESNLIDVHTYMLDEVQKFGGNITRCYFAPKLASENDGMRKPGSGMGFKAKSDFPSVDFNRSVMIGDSDSDIEFGKRLGMKTVKIGNGHADTSNADMFVTSLSEFVKQLKK